MILVCGQDVIPWISRWNLMVVPHWSGRNSTRVSWWCLIGQEIIPWPPVSGSSWWCLMLRT